MHAKSPFFTFAANSLKILAIFYRVHFISAAIFSTDRRSIARTDRRRVGKVIRTKHAAKLSAANFLCICRNSLTFISSLGKRWKSRCKLIIIYHESPAKVETCSNNAAVVVVGWLMRDDWSSDKKKREKRKAEEVDYCRPMEWKISFLFYIACILRDACFVTFLTCPRLSPACINHCEMWLVCMYNPWRKSRVTTNPFIHIQREKNPSPCVNVSSNREDYYAGSNSVSLFIVLFNSGTFNK